MRTAALIALALLAAPAGAQATKAYIIDGSGYFGAPGIQIGTLGEFDLADPSQVTILSRPAHDLRFGGADVSPTTGDLVAFENSTNSVRVLDRTSDSQTLIDSIGWMESGVVGFTFSNDGTKVYTTTAVGGFARIVEADAATGAVLSVHNILTNPLSSLATVPPGHPTLPEGEIIGLALTGFGSLNVVRLDLETNTVTDEQFLTGVGFNPQFETGLDFAADGTLYALIQGYRQLGPDTFEEISSHLYTLDPISGVLTEIGVVQADATWDGVCLALEDGPPPCPADLDGNGALNLDDVNLFANAFVGGDLLADLDGNGSLNLDDVNLFANAFVAGCP
ncbi:MAG: GC-type dockerin domain-anchored protein [Phycisphaerales bacterium]